MAAIFHTTFSHAFSGMEMFAIIWNNGGWITDALMRHSAWMS